MIPCEQNVAATNIGIKTTNCSKKLDRTEETLRGKRIKLSASDINFLDSSELRIDQEDAALLQTTEEHRTLICIRS